MSTRTWIMLAAGLSLALFLAACQSPNPQPVGLTPVPSLAPGATPALVSALAGAPGGAGVPVSVVAGPADAALGAPVYLENCSPCHGVQGQGVDAPPLRNNQFIQTAQQQTVFALIANGRPGTAMPAWLQANGGSLTDAQINNVIAFLKTFQNVSSIPVSTPMPPEPTETPLPPGAPTPEPAQPSNPGSPGPAAAMAGDITRGKVAFGLYCAPCHGPDGARGIPNPGSDDGSVPALSPIDPTLANPDPRVFASNLDLFIEHGSVPSGDSPQIMMPSFGDSKMLADQQIADLIAYVISLNRK
jgi:mono/diheme cytochrome c family protein